MTPRIMLLYAKHRLFSSIPVLPGDNQGCAVVESEVYNKPLLYQFKQVKMETSLFQQESSSAMKTVCLLVVVFFASGFSCFAQDNLPADQPATQQTSERDAATLASRNTYIIGPSDIIIVTVFKEPNLSGSLLVRPDGMISMPLLGDIQASGKMPLYLADEITAKLKKYMQDPNVTVVLSQINSKKVYLIGEVAKTGPVEMTPNMTLLQAIATAGGLGPYANSKKIYILRDQDGKQKKISVQYKQALKGDASLNLILTPGDTIIVP